MRRPCREFLQPLVSDSEMQGPVGLELARNVVTVDEVAHEVGTVTEQFQQTLSVLRSQFLRKIVRHDPHAGIDQTDIPPGSPEAELLSLQKHNIGPGLGKMQGGGQPCVSAADDHDLSE